MPAERLDDGRVRLEPPLSAEDVRAVRAGDVALIRGVVYAARDAAHKRLIEDLDAGRGLPFEPEGAIVYYVGPTPERPGNVIGSAGPTTASRMDRYTPRLLELGVRAFMGKGGRGPEVREALRARGAISLAALGGGGAVAARSVQAQRVIAYEDLGPEAVRAIELDDFPAWVINDTDGADYYAQAATPWRRPERLPQDPRRD